MNSEIHCIGCCVAWCLGPHNCNDCGKSEFFFKEFRLKISFPTQSGLKLTTNKQRCSTIILENIVVCHYAIKKTSCPSPVTIARVSTVQSTEKSIAVRDYLN